MMMKKLVTLLLVVLPLVNMAQKMAFVPGQVMIQTNKNGDIQAIERSLQNINGISTGIKVAKLLSKPMRIYLLEFDVNFNHSLMFQRVSEHPATRIVQNNHYISERATTPNDSQFGSQWHHVNTGAGGATADADIDTDEAWDITTGGVTALGDTIVVCILEGGGGDLTHPDLEENAWFNYAEIPNNSIDDDGNGYVDDFKGWDVSSNDDNFSGGGHGTSVAGMIGAKGDNNLGIAGANWNVKMMMIGGNSTQEASVIEAYTYPLVMRQLYHSSGGTKGAFVVATNASWGIDGGDTASAPLWCAMYDTLGVYGILNAGATANNDVDIDQVGDLPTACSSDYMISVTATNDADVRTFSGYGQTTIDFGAPGENVYTTSNGGGYGGSTGTSFASPLTAGVIALMYSTPCATLAQLALADPQAAADRVRLHLMNGVDPISNLANECVTGGRVNAFNSVQLIMNNCGSGGCMAPFSIATSAITDTSATISWNSIGGISYGIQIREVGNTVWSTYSVANNTLTIDTLKACTEYEYQLQTICDTANSGYTNPVTFTTDGCCESPIGIAISSIAETTAMVSWNSVLAATSYNVRIKKPSAITWNSFSTPVTSYTVAFLDSCTAYEVQVQTNCDTGSTAWSTVASFITLGCEDCSMITVCPSNGQDTDDEWIESFELNTLNNVSGNDGGYADNSGLVTSLYLDSSYTTTITPGFSGTSYPESYKIWIDFNQDGDFDDAGENVYSDGPTSSTSSGSIQIPNTAALGTSKLRVSMKYNGFGGSPPTSCESFSWGEVEDYCVNIMESTSSVGWVELMHPLFNLYPNPAKSSIIVEFNTIGSNREVELIDAMGQVVLKRDLFDQVNYIDIARLPNGIYFTRVRDDLNILVSKLVVQ